VGGMMHTGALCSRCGPCAVSASVVAQPIRASWEADPTLERSQLVRGPPLGRGRCKGFSASTAEKCLGALAGKAAAPQLACAPGCAVVFQKEVCALLKGWDLIEPNQGHSCKI
jgi:hypothetical protein